MRMKKLLKFINVLLILLLLSSSVIPEEKGNRQKWQDEYCYIVKRSPAMLTADKFQRNLAKALSVDTLDVVFNNSNTISKMLGKAMQRDSTMSESFDHLADFGVQLIWSDDHRMRFAWWEMKGFGDHQYGYIFQYKVAPNRTHVKAGLDRFLNLEMRPIQPIALHTLSRDIYLFEGRERDSLLRFVGFDLSTNVIRTAYVNDKRTFESSLTSTKEEFDKLYFNGVYLAPIDVHLADSLTQGRILRAWYRDGNNRYHITRKSPNASVTFVTDLFDNGMGTDSILPVASVNVAMGERKHTFKAKNFDSRFVIEGMNVEAVLKNDSIYNNPDKEGFPSIHYVCGRTSAVPHEKVIYTACSFDRMPTDEEYKQMRWALEVGGYVYFLNSREHFGSQIKLELKEEWEGKTISVVPYFNVVDLNIAAQTSVVKYAE